MSVPFQSNCNFSQTIRLFCKCQYVYSQFSCAFIQILLCQYQDFKRKKSKITLTYSFGRIKRNNLSFSYIQRITRLHDYARFKGVCCLILRKLWVIYVFFLEMRVSANLTLFVYFERLDTIDSKSMISSKNVLDQILTFVLSYSIRSYQKKGNTNILRIY